MVNDSNPKQFSIQRKQFQLMEFKKRGYKLAIVTFSFFVLLSRLLHYKRALVTIGVFISSFMLWFHRNPNREADQSGSHLSPVDGKVQDVDEDDGMIRISIYLGLTDVHTVRSMSDTRIRGVERGGSGNYPALLRNMSEKNNSLNYEFDNGDEVSVFTGFLARRLVNESNTGDHVDAGDEIGFISFGSRCVIQIDERNIDEVYVSEGDYVKSGSSVIGVKNE